MTISNGYATLAEVKNWIAITSTSTTDDQVIEDMVEGASRQIDKLTGGRTFYARTETHYYSVPRTGQTLWIDDDDLLTITSLKNGDESVISSDDYHLIPKNKNPKYAIKLTTAVSWVSQSEDYEVEAAGTWGYVSSAPDDIKQATIDIVVNAYHRRFGQGQSGQTVIAGGGILITPEDVPSSAMSIIKTYRRLV
jgi:hypothetical protein